MKTKFFTLLGLTFALAALPEARAWVWDTSTNVGVTLDSGVWQEGGATWTGAATAASGNGTVLSGWTNGSYADFNRTVSGNTTISGAGSYTVTLGGNVTAAYLRVHGNSPRDLIINGDGGGAFSTTITSQVSTDNSSGDVSINAPIILAPSLGSPIFFCASSNATRTMNVGGLVSGNAGIRLEPKAGAIWLQNSANSFSGNITDSKSPTT